MRDARESDIITNSINAPQEKTSHLLRDNKRFKKILMEHSFP